MTFDMSPSSDHQFPHQNSAGMRISREGNRRRVPRLAQVLSQLSAALTKVDHLNLTTKLFARLASTTICGWRYDTRWTSDVEWPRLLHQFPTPETLLVSWDLAEFIASAL